MNLFSCKKHPGNLRLTEQSCADSWRIANKNDERMQICRGCEIGAQHAGEPVANIIYKSNECIRCGRYGFGRKMNNGLCISCYNRSNEIYRGLNGKRHVPQKCKLYVILLIVNGQPKKIHVGKSQLVECILRTFQDGNSDISWPDLTTHSITPIPVGYDKVHTPTQIVKQLESL